MQNVVSGIQRHASLVLVALLLAAPALPFPDVGFWRGMRPFLIQTSAFTLLLFLLAGLSWSPVGLKRFAATGPNVAILVFTAWCALSLLLIPQQGQAVKFAAHELLRIVAGLAVYFAAMYWFGSRERQNLVLYALLLGGVAAAIAGVVTYMWRQEATGALGNRQLLAGVLVILTPLAAAFSVRGLLDFRRGLALVSFVLLAAALILARNRSSWAGALVGLSVVGGLALTDPSIREHVVGRRLLVAPALALVACAGLFFAFSGSSGATRARLGTLTELSRDNSFQNRLDLWTVGAKMVAEKPITGHGLGSFVRLAGRYDPQFSTPSRVDRVGPTLKSNAHNTYVTVAAQLGLVGLALYLSVFVGFFVRALRSLGRVGSDTRRWLLIGSMGAIAAQMVDAIGNPGWEFSEVSSLLWLVLGFGMAATRTHGERAAAPRSSGERTADGEGGRRRGGSLPPSDIPLAS